MHKNNLSIGLVFIAIGIISILNKVLNLNILNAAKLWPLLLLIPGLVFEISYFSTRREPGLLVPGGILSVIGLLFFFQSLTNWQFIEYWWPIIPLSVAFGLFQLYIFYRKHQGLLIPIFILSSISIISWIAIFLKGFFSWIDKSLILPFALIVIGICIIIKNSNIKRLF